MRYGTPMVPRNKKAPGFYAEGRAKRRIYEAPPERPLLFVEPLLPSQHRLTAEIAVNFNAEEFL